MRRSWLLLICFVSAPLVAPALRAQAAPTDAPRVVGVVRLRSSNAAIADATVAVEGTDRITRTDSLGRYTLQNVPPGPQVLLVRRLGYAPARTPMRVPARGTLTLDLVIATSALQLDQLIVTADRSGRARGELGTASVIDRDAIANQIASSLLGVLELLPGVVLQAPGLDAPAQFSLRALAQPSIAGTGGASGPTASDIGASGTLIVLDGVPLSNNANLQSVGARGEVASTGSTAGGGIDLRRIPAATLERVEVIRGIPSARWGDLTQGAIIVDTRAAASAPELAARFDPRTSEGNVVGGRAYRDDRQAITLTANIAQTASVRTFSNATTTRGAGQLAHRIAFGAAPGDARGRDGRAPLPRLSFDTRVDWFQLTYASPERPDIEVGRNSFTDDHGVRIGERARLVLAGGVLEWTGALDAQSQSTRESRRLGRPTTPFTDRVTDGRALGRYVEGVYLAEYALLGAPRFAYSRLEWARSTTGPHRVGSLRFGAESRREWNAGSGYQFAIDRPPQASPFNGTAGFDRPRTFRDIAALATSALYADTRLAISRGGVVAEVQPGVRLETLHDGGAITGGVRAAMVQPRITVQVAPRPWVRLRGGAGVLSKTPTVGQLSPALQYYDVVNVNRFTPDPRERLAVITTFIRDPTTPTLGLSRAAKREAGFELDGGARRGALAVTWFDDRVTGAVTLRTDPMPLERARYTLIDTARGSGQPGRIVDPPVRIEPVPVLLNRFVNSGTLGSRGAEFTLALPVIMPLRTRLEISGATISTRFVTDDRNYGSVTTINDFQVDTAIKRITYYERISTRSSRAIVTYRLVHHQPDLGLVLTVTAQQRLNEEERTLSRTDSLGFAGYIGREGVLVPVSESERGRAEFADLRRLRPSVSSGVSRAPDDWLMSLQVAKSLGRNGRLSFYVFNALDKQVTFSSNGAARVLPASRFGAELTLPMTEFFGSGR